MLTPRLYESETNVTLVSHSANITLMNNCTKSGTGNKRGSYAHHIIKVMAFSFPSTLK